MEHLPFSRRQWLTAAAGSLPLLAAAHPIRPQTAPKPVPAFRPCLNMSTLMGHKLGFRGELEAAAKAGFRSVEVWVSTTQDYLKTASTAEARRLIGDLGLTIENAIGFAPWIVNDDAARAKGVDQLKREMAMLAELGCKRVATPSIGAQQPDAPIIPLPLVTERYRHILQLGEQAGVIPQLELWGFAKNLNRLGDVLYVAIESGRPTARVLLDIYHLHKGGSEYQMLPLVGKPLMEVFHVNDFPANMPLDKLADADRVFPGDGVAPITEALRSIQSVGRTIVLSLEVFNKAYYARPAQEVANEAFAKMKAMIAKV